MSQRPARTNWAGNVTFRARRYHEPSTIDELRSLVAGSGRVRALGSGHSFNHIADTSGDLVSVVALPRIIDIDRDNNSVTVSAAIRYGELARYLDEHGYALRNLASLPHISIAGACATGTHGSGDGNQNLAAAVSAVELVTATGDLVEFRRDDASFGGASFGGAVLALGCLGVLTRMSLDVVPTFDVRQDVYDGLPLQRLVENFDEIFASGYSVSAFTRWHDSVVDQLWCKRRVDSDDRPPVPADWFGARPADGPRHPVPGMDVAHCTEQLGVPGPWYRRLPHFRPEFTPSSGAELQSEYLVPRSHAVQALAALERVAGRLAPVLQVCEIRTVAADELWISPSYRRDCVALHFTWVEDGAAVRPVLRVLAEQLAPFDARPHWGKLFDVDIEQLRRSYERLPDFQRLMLCHDPDGKFGNDFVRRYVLAGGSPDVSA